MKQLGDPRKTSVLRHVKQGVMRVGRPFRLYDGKQGRAQDKKRIREELTTMPCDKCHNTGVFQAGPEEFRCRCPKGEVELPPMERLEIRVQKLEDENAALKRRIWLLEQRVFR